MNTKIIVITGGVYSSLGKGIVASSIGRVLTEFNYKISLQKLDPYLNVDPGTLSPYQHGEVFVTSDGTETDLDLGHYERFISRELSKHSSVTAGAIYYEVLNNERKGYYDGKTVQVIPHITCKIQEKIKNIIDNDKPDFLIIEVGGTIGDIESLPFIEALRTYSIFDAKQMMFIHCAPLIKLSNNEIKTKPIQHSIKTLMNLGINPNVLVIRSQDFINDEIYNKLSWSCGLDKENIFISIDSNSIYNVPKILYNQKILDAICRHFNIKPKSGNMENWNQFLETIENNVFEKKEINICVLGKYTELEDSYLSVIESLKLAGYKEKIKVNVKMVNSTKINVENYESVLSKFDGILIPGGFGERGIQGKILGSKFARENKIPFFGICLGMQVACIEFAINVLNYPDANSSEFNSETKHPIFDLMPNLKIDLGGSLRLGNRDIVIKENTLAFNIYRTKKIVERHRHRYSFNYNYIDDFEKNGIIFSGISKENNNIVEVIELVNHPFYIGVQFHPEFKSKPNNPHSIFSCFINASYKNKLGIK